MPLKIIWIFNFKWENRNPRAHKKREGVLRFYRQLHVGEGWWGSHTVSSPMFLHLWSTKHQKSLYNTVVKTNKTRNILLHMQKCYEMKGGKRNIMLRYKMLCFIWLQMKSIAAMLFVNSFFSLFSHQRFLCAC